MEHRSSRTGAHRGGRARTAVVATLVVAALTIGVAAPAGADDGAPDVPAGNPFHDEISWLLTMGYALGYGDGTFRPGAPVTRQAFVAILHRLSETAMGGGHMEHGAEAVGDRMTVAGFPDVPADHPFHEAISWAAMHGIVEGYPDGTFRPGAPLTRQALIAVLHRLAGIHPDLGAAPFVDIAPDHPFRAAIAFAGRSNLSRGYPDGTFRAGAVVSRQALAALLWRFDQMMGHAWPAVDHHDVHCTDPVTPDQQEAADQLVLDVEASLARWPKVDDAIAAGYRFVAPPFGGAGAHYTSNAFSTDGIMMDPLKPESLMYDTNGDIEGAMFVMEQVGVMGPQPGGCLTQWHGHTDLCWTGPMDTTGTVTWIIDFGACPSNTMLRMTPMMLHVWIDGRPDPFEGLET